MLARQNVFSLNGPSNCSWFIRVVVPITLLLISCEAPAIVGEPVQLAARWRFADARSCDNSGVSVIAISGDGLIPSVALCSQGESSAFVFGALPPGPHNLLFEGRSPGGMPVYKAEVAFTLEANQPKELEPSLVFEGGP
jgi:hypothetical protein